MAALLKNPKISIARCFFSTISSSSSEKPSIPFRSIKSTIRSESDPEKIAEIFQKSSDSSLFRCDRPLFDLSVRKLARLRRPDLVERVLEHQISIAGASESNTEGFWIRIMKLYSDSGMVDQAVRTFDQMADIGCDRTQKSLCALLTAFLSNGQFNRVHDCFAEMPKKIGVSPNVAAYNLVLKAFVAEKSLAPARSLVANMEKELGVIPDLASYNILLGGYLELGDESGFNEILKEISLKGFSPNVVTYNHRILFHRSKNETFKAKELLEVMDSKGIKPNSASFNAVIDGFCKEGDIVSAKSVFESMRGCEYLLPNSTAYVMMIRNLVEKGEFELALDLCKESLRRKWVPPFESMVGLVKGLVKISKVDEAKDVVESMKKKLTGRAVGTWMKVEAALPL
eukprot:TRINITY_DN3681_c0_g1_i2.p1 TRINITY_DN3681_c0_g1~~TRINITY_DN3681_c0_g1_i2.p1  ORF type:complete len:399 (-),score=62.26 TRINITY_DN3681_c0_g1_i2:125-1321(-)